MEVTVDIQDTDKPYVPGIRADEPLFATDIFATQEEGAEALIEQIIADNISQTFAEQGIDLSGDPH